MPHSGSCHCGKTRFELDADLSQGTGKCNCSFCAKVRNWTVIVKPAAVRFLSGESELANYGFRPDSVNRHLFCSTCGVRIGTRGNVPELGGDFFSVSIAALDNLSDSELAALPVRCMNGRQDNWMQEPALAKHL